MSWKRMSLRARIFILLTSLVAATLGGGLVTMWYFSRLDNLFATVIERDITALETAAGLEGALVMQKGFVTYYYLDGDPVWLKELERYHHAFHDWLKKAQRSAYQEEARNVLNEIELQYIHYLYSRDKVIHLYKIGEREEGVKLHRSVRDQFLRTYSLCEDFKRIHEQSLTNVRNVSRKEARFINSVAMVIMPAVIVLGALLYYILLKQVLGPIRRLAVVASAGPGGRVKMDDDEVHILSRRVHSLMEDVDQTQTKLRLSREHLLQSEKLAMVGKLAAGVAHSIRNPLTSVKMRLFSLNRTLDLTPTQKEDFDVISEEIRHIDTIVRNFLEFSRPPKLKVQRVSPSDAVDMALQLLRHRIESYGVEVELHRKERLPQILGDPEQLKEVLVNLLVNACESFGDGGLIAIREDVVETENNGPAAVIEVCDNGPGIPEAIRDKVFQPFFSTKEEGTGLGLSIAMRIVEDHQGTMDIRSEVNKGTTLRITLPLREK